MKRVAPSVRMKEGIERLLRGEGREGDEGGPPLHGFVRSAAQYMLQVAIEAEATAFLGRGHYRRGSGCARAGVTAMARSRCSLLELAVPQFRATTEPFRPAVMDHLSSRTPLCQ